MPSSFITAMASGLTRPGFVPALSTSKRSPASCSSNPSAIWLRAEFPVQRIKTRFFMVLVLHLSVIIHRWHEHVEAPHLSLQREARAQASEKEESQRKRRATVPLQNPAYRRAEFRQMYP